MKNSFVFCILSLLLLSCSQDNSTRAKVFFAFPERVSNVDKRSMAASVDGFTSSTWNGQINTAAEIDCYGLYIGGPEAANQRNFCNEKTTDQELMRFGRYVSAIAAGSAVEIELESDVLRTVTIVGMSSSSGECVSFDGFSPPSLLYSFPRVLHQKDYTFKTGAQSVPVVINGTFDNTNPEIDHCRFDSIEEPPSTAPSAGLLSFNPSGAYDFGSQTVASSTTTLITITNSGTQDVSAMSASGLSSPFGFAGGSYPGTGGSCGSTLIVGASCTIDIEFTPVAAAGTSQILTLAYNNGSGTIRTLTKNILGTGTSASTAVLAISDGPTYNFGTQPAGGNQQYTFTITNTGTVAATAMGGTGLATPFNFAGGTYPGGGSCGTTLAAAASCTVIVDYSPSVPSASDSDTMIINYNDGLAAQVSSRGINGVAVAPANITITESDPYNFGTVVTGNSASHIFTVTNVGGVAATIASSTTVSGAGLAAPFNFTGGVYPGSSGNCGVTIAAGASCSIEIHYSPVSPGVDSDTIQVNYNNGAVAQGASRDVTGTGILPALLTISESDPYDFGSIPSGSVAAHVFTITNSGSSTATSLSEVGLVSPFQFSGGSYPGSGGTCGLTLSPAGSCTIEVAFSPTIISTFSSSIDIQYNDGASAQVASRLVDGTGLAPAVLTITGGDPYDFGTVSTVGSSSVTFTVTNGGGVTATGISDAGGLAAPFDYLGGGGFPGTGGSCGGTLVAGGSCTVTVSFAPPGMTVYNDTLVINYTDGVSGQVLNHGVTGTGVP